jgi:hypothetical protein
MAKQERKRLTVGDMIDRINGYPKDTVLITSAGAVVRLEYTPAAKGSKSGGTVNHPISPFPATLEFQTEDDI